MHQSNQYSRQATSGINSGTASIDIPERPDTPAIQTGLQHNTMAPLERWVESPPESEPATVTDIVNAVQSAKSTQSKDIGWFIGGHVTHKNAH
jgi:hypothetical protein